jgi:hypothetical protein
VSDAVFEIKDDAASLHRGRLVICTVDGETGAARIGSKGEQDARDRAEAQARGKVAERDRGPAE